ncbi:hypothetical protein ACOMHN_029747 [Nucella lapillus]
MSQSAENQSAIIENENNYNIAMESQAAEGESSRVGVHLEGVPTADSEPGTPTQDEVEQRPDMEEALGSNTRAGDFASNKETGEDFTAGAGETDLKYGEETGLIPPAGEPTESQDELRPQSPTERQGQEEGAVTMEVDPPQLDGSAHIQGQENVSNEPEGTDCIQDDNSDQQYLGEGKESEPVSSQAEPESHEAEADSHSALAPNSEVEEDRGGIAAEDVDMEGQEFQQDNALDEDQNIPMVGTGLQGDSEAPEEDQSLAVGGEQGQQGESGMLQEDQNLDMGEGAEEQWGEGVSSHKDQNLTVKETERQEMESENAPVEGVDHGESGTAGEDQTLAMEEGAEGNQDESGIPEEDHNPPMEETERQPADSGELEDQNLPVEDTEHLGEPEQDQNIPTEDTEHLGEPEQDQNLPAEGTEQLGEQEQDQNLPVEDTEQLDEPEQDQNLPVEDKKNLSEQEQDQNLPVPVEDTEQSGEPEQDRNLPMEDTEQLGEPEQDQNLPVEDTKQLGEPDETVAMEEGEGQECESGTDHEIQNLPVGDSAEQEDLDSVPDIEENLAWREADQLAESERTEGDQNLSGGKTEAGQQEQDDAIDEERLLAEDNSQDEQQADDQSQNVHSESQRNEDAAEASECQPDSSITGDTKASDEMSDHDAGIKEETSTNEDENITGVDSIRETKDTHLQSEKVNGNGEAGDNLPTSGDTEATEMDHETTEASVSNTTNLESKSSNGVDKLVEDTEQALDPEADRASDVTIVEGRDADDEPMLKVTNIKSGADAEDRHDEKQDSVGDVKPDEASLDTGITSEAADKVSESAGESEMADAQTDAAETEKIDIEQKRAIDEKKSADDDEDDDDDVVVLENEADSLRKNNTEKEVLNSNNDMGIQIESVSGGANDVHGTSDHADIKQENTGQKSNQTSAAAPKADKSGAPPVKKSRTQTCIVCKKIGKCKYNIVRNGDIKHLCDEACFKRFRANPTVFLKGSGSSGSASAAEKKSGDVKASGGATATQGLGKPPSSVPGYKTCTVCLLMNLNSQGHFCIWKGLDFCGEGCLGKFQSGISSSCALCSTFIPLASRPTHCLRLGSQMRPFCSNRCYADFKLRLRLCTQCQKDASSASDAFFSAPVGSDGSFKDFCSQVCMKKFEELLNTDVEIIRVEAGKPRSVNKCSVCQKKEIVKHIIKYKGTIHNLCSDSCISAFQYANKLDMKTCEFCSTLCTSRESSLHTVQFEGHQKQFCSDKCVTKFRFDNRKVSPCSWCGTQRDNFDMIERLDSASKYQLFCSLNCLSLYRVNLQAKSNQPVTCDQCSKRAPAQYHLTMSDASVRNFCSYNCVMTFQAQFSKGPTSAEPPTPAAPAPVPQPSAAKQPNTRGRSRRGNHFLYTFPSLLTTMDLSFIKQIGQQVLIDSKSYLSREVYQRIRQLGLCKKPRTARHCRAGRLHRLWHNLPPAAPAQHNVTPPTSTTDLPAITPADNNPPLLPEHTLGLAMLAVLGCLASQQWLNLLPHFQPAHSLPPSQISCSAVASFAPASVSISVTPTTFLSSASLFITATDVIYPSAILASNSVLISTALSLPPALIDFVFTPIIFTCVCCSTNLTVVPASIFIRSSATADPNCVHTITTFAISMQPL